MQNGSGLSLEELMVGNGEGIQEIDQEWWALIKDSKVLELGDRTLDNSKFSEYFSNRFFHSQWHQK